MVFTDANVMFAPDALPRLLRPFADPEVGCVCGHLVYTAPDGSPTAATGSLYWRLEERIKQLESRTGSVMGADGSIFAIRRALHRPPPRDIIDDMYVSLPMLCDGHRVVRAEDALAYEEIGLRPAEEFRRKVRIACQAFNVHRLLRPRLRGCGARPLQIRLAQAAALVHRLAAGRGGRGSLSRRGSRWRALVAAGLRPRRWPAGRGAALRPAGPARRALEIGAPSAQPASASAVAARRPLPDLDAARLGARHARSRPPGRGAERRANRLDAARECGGER